MPLFAVGCLHMGDGSETDNFRHCGGEWAFCEFLGHVEKEYGQLAILGDAFEGLQANLSKTVVFRSKLLDRCARRYVRYAPGNHDRGIKHFCVDERRWLSHPFFDRMAGEHLLVRGDRRFLLAHGHQADPACASDGPGLDSITALLAAVVERFVGSPLFGRRTVEGLTVGRLERLVDLAGQLVGRPSAAVAFNRRLRQKWPTADVIVHAHTHRAGLLRDKATGRIWGVNVGTWAEPGQFSFARISPDGEVALFNWVDGKAVPNETLLPY